MIQHRSVVFSMCFIVAATFSFMRPEDGPSGPQISPTGPSRSLRQRRGSSLAESGEHIQEEPAGKYLFENVPSLAKCLKYSSYNGFCDFVFFMFEDQNNNVWIPLEQLRSICSSRLQGIFLYHRSVKARVYTIDLNKPDPVLHYNPELTEAFQEEHWIKRAKFLALCSAGCMYCNETASTFCLEFANSHPYASCCCALCGAMTLCSFPSPALHMER